MENDEINVTLKASGAAHLLNALENEGIGDEQAETAIAAALLAAGWHRSYGDDGWWVDPSTPVLPTPWRPQASRTDDSSAPAPEPAHDPGTPTDQPPPH